MSYFVVLGAFFLSLTYSANILNLTYDSSWSPESLEKTASYLRAKSHDGDRVMSGAVIWEFQALRRPFLNISHPLAFQLTIPKNTKERIRHTILTHPPEVIILDGYTEKTYLRLFPWLIDFLSSSYKLVHSSGPAKYPIQVYQLISSLEANIQISHCS